MLSDVALQALLQVGDIDEVLTVTNAAPQTADTFSTRSFYKNLG